MSKCIAIIPARGGSKRIPRKNIKNFLGQPIIKYSLDTAKEAGCFDEIIVSTDDREIAEIAKKYGASVPFLRSSENASDTATLEEVVREVLLKLEKMKKEYDYICCILPTAPLLDHQKVIKGLGILQCNKETEAVFPVVQFGYPIQRAFRIMPQGEVGLIWPENEKKRSQDLEETYHDAGQFYWLKKDPFLSQRKIFLKKTYPLVLNEKEVQDIDTPLDWEIAEAKYRLLYPKRRVS